MEDLIAFVKARLDEAEVVAKESADLARKAGWVTDDEIDGWNFGAHPMRDLRDIAAKRARLALMAEATAEMDKLLADQHAGDVNRAMAIGRARAATVAVKYDAAIWSDHFDYQAEFAKGIS